MSPWLRFARDHPPGRVELRELDRTTDPAPNDEVVELTLALAGGREVSIKGNRFDVHRLIIEADRQLSRLVDRFTP